MGIKNFNVLKQINPYLFLDILKKESFKSKDLCHAR